MVTLTRMNVGDVMDYILRYGSTSPNANSSYIIYFICALDVCIYNDFKDFIWFGSSRRSPRFNVCGLWTVAETAKSPTGLVQPHGSGQGVVQFYGSVQSYASVQCTVTPYGTGECTIKAYGSTQCTIQPYG